MAKKIVCGFGAGMGYIGETCGAVTGVLMLIGLKCGKVHVEDNGAKDKTYDLVSNDLAQVEVQVRELMPEADIAYFSFSFGIYRCARFLLVYTIENC